MGFRFNPALQSTQTSYLYAGVLPGLVASINPNANEMVDAPGTVSIVYDPAPAPPPGVPVGPQVSFYNPGQAITFIKVAFVHSRFDYYLT